MGRRWWMSRSLAPRNARVLMLCKMAFRTPISPPRCENASPSAAQNDMTRAIALLLLVAATAPLSAYDFVTKTGLRWADGNIPMNLQLDETMPPQPLSDGKTSWNAVAQEALDIWNAQLSRVQFAGFSSSAGPGDGNDHNEVFF